VKQFVFLIAFLVTANFVMVFVDAGILFHTERSNTVTPKEMNTQNRKAVIPMTGQKKALKGQPFNDFETEAYPTGSGNGKIDLNASENEQKGSGIVEEGDFSGGGKESKTSEFLKSSINVIEEIKMSSRKRIEGLPSREELMEAAEIGDPLNRKVADLISRLRVIYEKWGYDFPDSLSN